MPWILTALEDKRLCPFPLLFSLVLAFRELAVKALKDDFLHHKILLLCNIKVRLRQNILDSFK